MCDCSGWHPYVFLSSLLLYALSLTPDRIALCQKIYCVDAMATLIQPSFKIYIDTFRDCYEAYVLYQFFSLLMAYLGGMEALETLLSLKMPMSHPFPLCYLPKIKLGGSDCSISIKIPPFF